MEGPDDMPAHVKGRDYVPQPEHPGARRAEASLNVAQHLFVQTPRSVASPRILLNADKLAQNAAEQMAPRKKIRPQDIALHFASTQNLCPPL